MLGDYLLGDHKKYWFLVRFFSPEASLDGVGVALKVKGRQSNEDIYVYSLQISTVLEVHCIH